jgi:hypothetical protein
VGNLSTPGPVTLTGGIGIPSTEQVGVTAGAIDYLTTGTAATAGRTTLIGAVANMAANGTFTNRGGGCYHIRVPISITFTAPLGATGVIGTFQLTGALDGDSCLARIESGVLKVTNTGQAATLVLTHAGTTTTLCGFNFPDTAYNSVEINTGAGNDTVAIEGTLAGKPVTVNGGAGNNTFYISPMAMWLNNIQGNVTINAGAGWNWLRVYDVTDTFNDTWILNTGNLMRNASARISYNNIAQVDLFGGVGSETYNFQGNGAGVTTVVMAGPSPNNFNLTPATQVLNSLQGTLWLFGGGGGDLLTACDRLDPVNDTWTIDSTSLTCVPAGGTGGLVLYSGLAEVTVLGGFGNNVWNINDTAPGTFYSFLGGAGNDYFRFCTRWGSLAQLQGSVYIDGGGGNNAIGLDDSGSTDNYTIQQVVPGFGSVAPASLGPVLVFDARSITTLYLATNPASVVTVLGAVPFAVVLNPAGGI